jgi:hypothetical protein
LLDCELEVHLPDLWVHTQGTGWVQGELCLPIPVKF